VSAQSQVAHVPWAEAMPDARDELRSGGAKKKTRLRLLAVLLLAATLAVSIMCSSASAGSVWKKFSPGFAFQSLYTVTFADSVYGWAFGFATAMATADGGAHWTQLTLPDAMTYPNAAKFVDSTHGWVAGAHYGNRYGTTGSIIGTSDGGTTWTTQVSDLASGALLDIDFADALHGWAVGGAGLILATSDGGATWVEQTSGVKQAIRKIDFVDAQNGWAVYYRIKPSRTYVLRTTDGGAHWTGGSIVCRSLSFDLFRVNAKTGWIACDAPLKTIVRTTDGGAHWKSFPLPAAMPSIDSLAFRDARHGIGAVSTSTGAAIFATSNGGASWTRAWSMPKGTYIGGISDVAVIDAGHAWAVGHRNFKDGLLVGYGQ
jgi:photosystem II stability/assembly factor-like uncharacterized protein